MKKNTPIALIACLLFACGKNDENNATTNNAASNNVAANNVATNNVAANNVATNNVATNNVASNNVATNNVATNNVATNNAATNNNTIVDCGAITFEGECVSATALQYCDDDFGLVEVDCASNLAAGAMCGDFPDWGADCVVTENAACEIWDGTSGTYQNVYCAGDDAACIWTDTESGKCQTGFTAPTCDVDSFTESCEGNVYLYDCHIDQAIGADCVAVGGLCDGGVGCVMPMGAPCDDLVLICSAGLTCNIADTDALGTCE